MPGSDEVDVLVVAASTEGRIRRLPRLRAYLVEIWMPNNTRLTYSHVVVVDMIATVDERVATLGYDAALLKAECHELDANPDNGRDRGFSDIDDADRANPRPVSCSTRVKGAWLNRGPKHWQEDGCPIR